MMAAREWYGSGWDDGCWEYSSASSPVWDDCLPAVWGGHCCAPDAAFSGSFSLESAVHSSILNGWLTAVCVSWHSSLPRRQMCVFRGCLCSFDCCVTISTLPPFFFFSSTRLSPHAAIHVLLFFGAFKWNFCWSNYISKTCKEKVERK